MLNILLPLLGFRLGKTAHLQLQHSIHTLLSALARCPLHGVTHVFIHIQSWLGSTRACACGQLRFRNNRVSMSIAIVSKLLPPVYTAQ